MLNRKSFFDKARSQPFGGAFTDGQVAGTTAILDEWERRELENLHWLAYMLATAKWETANTMQPIKEMGSPAYLHRKPYWPWIGRGYVQLTWERNYQRFRDRVLHQFNVDIVANADLALQEPVAAYVMFEGMLNGEFTGKKLPDYFNATRTDWINARRIINGADKAVQISMIAKNFNAALVAASS